MQAKMTTSVKVPKSDSPKRPRGRPRLDKPNKRVKTLRLAVDVCDYLDTTDNQATAIEDAIRASKAYKEKKHVSRTKQ